MSTELKSLENWNKQSIGGEWRFGNSELVNTIRNPMNNEVLAEIKQATIEDINEAYTSASEQQKVWFKRKPEERVALIKRAAEVLEAMREEFVEALMLEAGSTAIKANIEVDLAISDINEFSSFPLKMSYEVIPSVIPDKENRVYTEPVGVVGVISPFNFSLYLSMRAVIAALASGNGVVIKPDSQTPITGGFMISKLYEKAGFPRGLLNVVSTTISETGDAFVEHPIPQAISFTGSTGVGRHIAKICGENLKRVSLELGGNNVMIVLEDAELDNATSAAVFGKFLHQGQICMSLNRIIVHEAIYDEFIEKFKQKTASLKTGNPADPEVFVGPLINEAQVEKLTKWVDSSVKQGATVISRGKAEGTLIEPIILSDVTNDMDIAQYEQFGPVAAIIKVGSEEEAIQIANDSDYGLTGSVYSGDIDRGIDVALQVKTGMIHVNDQSVNCESNIPFGGEKSSGLGRYGGEWSLSEFTTKKWVSVQTAPRPFPF